MINAKKMQLSKVFVMNAKVIKNYGTFLENEKT